MVSAGFILLTIIVAFFFTLLVSKASAPNVQKSIVIKTALALLIWLAYITGLSLIGFFKSAGLPPRVPLFLVLPFFTFIIFFVNSKAARPILNGLDQKSLVYFQSFRILVELLLFLSFREGKIPVMATFEGYNYDIVIGILAIIVPALALRNGTQKSVVLIVFNLLGISTLAVVVFIFMSYSYNPSFWGLAPSADGLAIGAFPYTLLAGFLMPVAVFLHVASLKNMAISRKVPALSA